MTSPLRSVRGTQILGVVLAFMIPLSAAAQRLPQNVWPTGQAISLNLDARETSYTGSVSIDLEVEETLERVTDQVNDCVNLRRREGASVAKYFAE